MKKRCNDIKHVYSIKKSLKLDKLTEFLEFALSFVSNCHNFSKTEVLLNFIAALNTCLHQYNHIKSHLIPA